MRFSISSQNSISEKSIFGHFGVLFLNVQIFLSAVVVFSCYRIQSEILQRKDDLFNSSQ